MWKILYKSILGALYGIGRTNIYQPLANITPIGPLWFIPCLFCSNILFFLFCKLLNKTSFLLQLILCLFITYIGVYIGKFIFLPWSLDISLVSLIFVFLGFCIKKYDLLQRFDNNKYKIVFTISLILIWYFLMLNSKISLNNRGYNNLIYAICATSSMSFILIYMCYKIQQAPLKIVQYINNIVRFIGVESMIILIMHARIMHNTPAYSMLKYNHIAYTIYIILFSLMIGRIIKCTPILKNIFYPVNNKN